MQPFTTLTSTIVCLPQRNIDTDQIIPARYLKGTSREGYGDQLFADWRYWPDGTPDPSFPLNQPAAHQAASEVQTAPVCQAASEVQTVPVCQAQILLAGDNFGCGSSREHAAWALLGFGFRAILSTSFADIFNNNALKNGLLPVRLGAADYERLLVILDNNPSAEFTINLEAQWLRQAGDAGIHIGFPIDPFAKECLLSGVDELGYLLAHQEQITAYEQRHDTPEMRP